MKKIAGIVLAVLCVLILGYIGISIFGRKTTGEVSVNHEWGALKEVIIGRGEDLYIPDMSDQIEKLEADPALKDLIRKNAGKKFADLDPEGSKKIIEQIDRLAEILEKRGVVVHRNYLYTPEQLDYLWGLQKGGSLLFARDPVVVIGNNIIETALQGPFRRKEKFSIRPILLEAAKASNAKYVSMPTASPRMPRDNDSDPFIEGGDVLLNGYEIYVGFSGRATNKVGIEWLKRYLGLKYKVYTIELRPDVLHLDCSIALLKPGLGLLCKGRIKGELPESLRSFDFVEVTEEEAKKFGTNVLVVNENTVIVDEQHKRIAEELRKKGQEVITVPYDAVAFWGGAFRCSHHPLRRDSKPR